MCNHNHSLSRNSFRSFGPHYYFTDTMIVSGFLLPKNNIFFRANKFKQLHNAATPTQISYLSTLWSTITEQNGCISKHPLQEKGKKQLKCSEYKVLQNLFTDESGQLLVDLNGHILFIIIFTDQSQQQEEQFCNHNDISAHVLMQMSGHRQIFPLMYE